MFGLESKILDILSLQVEWFKDVCNKFEEGLGCFFFFRVFVQFLFIF